MKYVRAKDKIIKVDETGYIKEIDVCGKKCLFLFNKNYLYGREVISQSDNIEELCDCFIIKYVESNTFSAYDKEDYSGARYVYTHDKQNTTCILYGVIETEIGLKYVAIETNEGLKLLCQN